MIAAMEMLFFRTRKVLQFCTIHHPLDASKRCWLWDCTWLQMKRAGPIFWTASDWERLLHSLFQPERSGFTSWLVSDELVREIQRDRLPLLGMGPTDSAAWLRSVSPDLTRLEGAWRITGKRLSRYAHVAFLTTAVIFTSTPPQPSGCLQKLPAREQAELHPTDCSHSEVSGGRTGNREGLRLTTRTWEGERCRRGAFKPRRKGGQRGRVLPVRAEGVADTRVFPLALTGGAWLQTRDPSQRNRCLGELKLARSV